MTVPAGLAVPPLPGSVDELYRSPRTVVFRTTTPDGRPAVVKTPATEAGDSE